MEYKPHSFEISSIFFKKLIFQKNVKDFNGKYGKNKNN